MLEKPSRAADYSKAQIQLAKETCLYIATVLGDYMEQVVIVGGLVSSILIDQKNLPDGADSHVGTMDLDLERAFEDKIKITLDGNTIFGEKAKRDVFNFSFIHTQNYACSCHHRCTPTLSC